MINDSSIYIIVERMSQDCSLLIKYKMTDEFQKFVILMNDQELNLKIQHVPHVP